MLRANHLSGFGVGGGSNVRTVSLLRFNGDHGSTTIVDAAKPDRVWVSANGASLSNVQSYSGGTSLRLAGSDGAGVGDFIYTEDIDEFQVGDQDFTIECWTWSNVSPSNIYAATGRATVSDADYLNYIIQIQNGTGAVDYIEASSDEATWGVTAQGQTGYQPFDGLWHHHAMTRLGDTISHYFDGVLRGSNPVSITPGFVISDIDVGNKFSVGAAAFDPHPVFPTADCYLDLWRFSIGARYLADFIPGDY